MIIFYALVGALNAACWMSDPNPWSVFGTAFCAAMFLREMARG